MSSRRSVTVTSGATEGIDASSSPCTTPGSMLTVVVGPSPPAAGVMERSHCGRPLANATAPIVAAMPVTAAALRRDAVWRRAAWRIAAPLAKGLAAARCSRRWRVALSRSSRSLIVCSPLGRGRVAGLLCAGQPAARRRPCWNTRGRCLAHSRGRPQSPGRCTPRSAEGSRPRAGAAVARRAPIQRVAGSDLVGQIVRPVRGKRVREHRLQVFNDALPSSHRKCGS